jgi:hypothetical protein
MVRRQDTWRSSFDVDDGIVLLALSRAPEKARESVGLCHGSAHARDACLHQKMFPVY